MDGTPILFKMDENLPEEVIDLLVEAGHDALSVRSQALTGSPDPRIASVCQSEKRALITLDLDFADIRLYPPGEHFGLMVLRQRFQDRDSVLATIQRIIPLLEREQLVGRLWIVTRHNVRIQE